jgi:3-dehydroquinate dehydratase/shikimate dehydrogenase
MICVTVTPVSRTLAKVDLLNAARMGDVIELCIDHLAKEPDFKDLIQTIQKPMIISCRRKADGGQWDGTEEERIMLLKQAVLAGPAYVELELDIAAKIPRFKTTQRIISVNRKDRPEYEFDSLYDEAVKAQADIVKFAWPTPTLDESWPLLAAVSQKRTIPIVGIGQGRAELTFLLLSKKYGAPFVYAALEKGMEIHPDQPTVHELHDTFGWNEIDRQTKFIAVGGFHTSAIKTLRVLNAGFRHAKLNFRCLPVQIGRIDRLEKMLDILKIQAVIADDELGVRIQPLAQHLDKTDAHSGFLDLLVKQADGWHGFNTLWRLAIKELERTAATPQTAEKPLAQKSILVIGTGGTAASMIMGIVGRTGIASIAGTNDKQAEEIARKFQARFVPFMKIYDTLVDIIILTDSQLAIGTSRNQINPSIIRPQNIVLDISHIPDEHPLLEEARNRHAKVIAPGMLFKQQLQSIFKLMTGQIIPDTVFQQLEN